MAGTFFFSVSEEGGRQAPTPSVMTGGDTIGAAQHGPRITMTVRPAEWTAET
jgi:hypothetical protein